MDLQTLLSTKVVTKNKDGKEISITPSFCVSVQKVLDDGRVHFIIHPDGVNGDTVDLIVQGNTLTQL